MNLVDRYAFVTHNSNLHAPQFNDIMATSSLTGSQIDIEIALRLSRALWSALSVKDDELAKRMRSSLQIEIDALRMQHDIDGLEDGDLNGAMAGMLEHYLESGASN